MKDNITLQYCTSTNRKLKESYNHQDITKIIKSEKRWWTERGQSKARDKGETDGREKESVRQRAIERG